MAMIHFVSLDPRIQNAIRNKQYSDEEIIKLNEKIKKDERTKKKTFIVTMTILTLLLLVGGIIIYGSEIGFPDALPLLLLNMFVVVIVGPISWYAAIGRMEKQWDDLMSLYYHDIYMDNQYGRPALSDEVQEKPVQITKTPVNGKSVLKKAYYIITIILSVLIMVLFVIVGVSSTSSRHSKDPAGASAAIVIAAIAAGSMFLSVKGLRHNCHIPGIILEKAGILFIGISLIVFITGLFSQGKMLEALAITIPALIIGVVCFIFGRNVINRKRDQHWISETEFSSKNHF